MRVHVHFSFRKKVCFQLRIFDSYRKDREGAQNNIQLLLLGVCLPRNPRRLSKMRHQGQLSFPLGKESSMQLNQGEI